MKGRCFHDVGEFFITGRIIFAPGGDFISVKKSPGANYLWQISPLGRVFPGNLSPAGGVIGAFLSQDTGPSLRWLVELPLPVTIGYFLP